MILSLGMAGSVDCGGRDGIWLGRMGLYGDAGVGRASNGGGGLRVIRVK